MEIKLSKTNSLVNLSNSILKKFSCQTFHNSNDEIDRILNSKGDQVCLILLDGFGKFVMEKYKEYCPFIYRHIKKEINSVYPPTTVAATTSLLSGKYPCETGYVGWNQYFKKYDQYIDVFPSKNPFTNEKINPPVTEDILKYETIIDIINKNNIYKARSFHSFDYINMSNNPIETMFEEANNLIDSYNFVYIYSTEPDHDMHGVGLDDKLVPEIVKELDFYIKNLVESHPNFLFLLIADHGMVNIENLDIHEFEDFYDSLEDKNFFIEGRFASFKVRDKNKFISAYNKHYKDKFILKTKQEILNENIFGYSSKYHHEFLETLGDYFLISNTEYALNNTLENGVLLGHHGGVTENEVKINLCVFD